MGNRKEGSVTSEKNLLFDVLIPLVQHSVFPVIREQIVGGEVDEAVELIPRETACHRARSARRQDRMPNINVRLSGAVLPPGGKEEQAMKTPEEKAGRN